MNEDLSKLLEQFNINKDSISPEMVNNLMGMLNNNSSTSVSSNENSQENKNETSQDSNNANNIDFDTILRMKTIIDKMNTKDDPRSNLLQSLKPYLNESRRSKVDQYINLMNMSKVMEVFPFFGGDKNVGKL